MSTFTATTPVTADTDSAAATTSTRGRTIGTRIAGIGGLAFIANVVVNNVLRGSFPKNDASATDVATFYAEHDVLTSVFAAIYPIGLVGIALFVAGVASRALSGPGRLWAIMGIVGSAGVAGGFSTLLAFDSAIAGYLHRGGTSTDVVEGLWVTHNAVFGILLGSIAVALAGLANAAASAGLLGRVWRPVSFVGAALLLAGTATTPAIIDGAPTMFLGFAGFAVWVAFVVTTSVRLIRR